MRISSVICVHLVESTPPKIVFINDETGEEITLNKEGVDNLRQAIDYFYPYIG